MLSRGLRPAVSLRAALRPTYAVRAQIMSGVATADDPEPLRVVNPNVAADAELPGPCTPGNPMDLPGVGSMRSKTPEQKQ